MRNSKRLGRIGAAAAFAAATAIAAQAAETLTFVYDARGRLVQVLHSGTVNNNVVTSYTLDKADNRTTKTTTGAP
jgi:YD repeat-containing protein